uniref:Uncharacterized protein n=1 Tax=Ditylenchus dipsaci TaxID=166011 RepID=A0A915CWR2_9BILA
MGVGYNGQGNPTKRPSLGGMVYPELTSLENFRDVSLHPGSVGGHNGLHNSPRRQENKLPSNTIDGEERQWCSERNSVEMTDHVGSEEMADLEEMADYSFANAFCSATSTDLQPSPSSSSYNPNGGAVSEMGQMLHINTTAANYSQDHNHHLL